MNIQKCIKEYHLTRTDKVVIRDWHKEDFDARAITAIIYENADYYHVRLSIPFDYNEKGTLAIGWGDWLKTILAIESSAFGIEMLVSIKGTDMIMKNPEKSFEGTPYSVSYLMPPPEQLTLKI